MLGFQTLGMAIGSAATSLLDLRSLLPFFEEMLYIDAGDWFVIVTTR